MAQQLANSTSILQDSGLIPGTTQWVTDPLLLRCRSLTQVGSYIAMSVALAGGYSSNWTASLGTSICRRCGPKRKGYDTTRHDTTQHNTIK